MKNLIIIGAGGMGREIFDLATTCAGHNKDYVIKGFLDDNTSALDNYRGYAKILSKIESYLPEPNDVFVSSMGNVKQKARCIELVIAKGGQFISLVHPQAEIGKNTILGPGCILLKNAYVGADCIIGSHVLIQISAVVGHDVNIGNYSRLDCNVVCVGGSKLEELVTVHTSTVINQNVVVEKGSTVGANSFVIRKVRANTSVFGSPAKRIS